MSVLSVLVFLPLVAALLLGSLQGRLHGRGATWVWVVVSGIELLLTVGLWIGYNGGRGTNYQQRVRWIPGVNSSYHVGVDGLSLPLVGLTALLFFVCAVYSLGPGRSRANFAAVFLFLETTSLGLFVSLDLILFFVFFDLSIVGMYFIIAGWGHTGAARAALKFFLYTFIGSLALLLGFIGLYVASAPHTFDMVTLTANPPLEGRPLFGGLVLLAIGIGLAVKTPLFPLHTWLPPAHTEAPAAGSAILAGILLKMGTYGFVRIAMPMLPEAWSRWSGVVLVIAVVSILWGALVALAQTNFKRMIAYTSVNHMGYVLLGLGAVGATGGDDAAKAVAATGAVTQMVSHGLITGSLFLLAGVMWERRKTYEMDTYGGVAALAPRFALLLAVASFASLGLPGLSGFIAEFQIFAGSLGPAPVATALALLGILVTAGLFLWALQRVLLGESRSAGRKFADLRSYETASIATLVLFSLVIGVLPRWLLDVIEPAARTLVRAVSGG